ncbi:MAG: fluoride efflux transporter CrcB [Pseudomonadota bacterium]
MMHYTVVALGGAVGAMARFWVYNATAIWGYKPAWATFGINALGAFLIGVFFVLLTEKSNGQPELRSLIVVGFLGAFTTYSTYSLDALQLFEQGQVGTALFYLFGTMLICLLATWLGLTLTRFVI